MVRTTKAPGPVGTGMVRSGKEDTIMPHVLLAGSHFYVSIFLLYLSGIFKATLTLRSPLRSTWALWGKTLLESKCNKCIE